MYSFLYYDLYYRPNVIYHAKRENYVIYNLMYKVVNDVIKTWHIILYIIIIIRYIYNYISSHI